MSWAVEEWKDGLPGKALQKIQEMEVQLDKLKKEKTQKQFQLDSLEAALQKQKQKVNIYQKCLNKCVLWETNWHIYLKRYPIKTFKISLRNTSPTISPGGQWTYRDVCFEERKPVFIRVMRLSRESSAKGCTWSWSQRTAGQFLMRGRSIWSLQDKPSFRSRLTCIQQ